MKRIKLALMVLFLVSAGNAYSASEKEAAQAEIARATGLQNEAAQVVKSDRKFRRNFKKGQKELRRARYYNRKKVYKLAVKRARNAGSLFSQIIAKGQKQPVKETVVEPAKTESTVKEGPQKKKLTWAEQKKERDKNEAAEKIAKADVLFAKRSDEHGSGSRELKDIQRYIDRAKNEFKREKYSNARSSATMALARLEHMKPPVKVPKGSKGIYRKDLVGAIWIEDAGSNKTYITFKQSSFTFDLNKKYKQSYPVVKINDKRGMFVLKIKNRRTRRFNYIPVWWEKVDANTVTMSKLVGTRPYTSLNKALSAPVVTPTQILKKE